MELVLTEVTTGGYRAHRPNCKKIVDKEQFDPEELTGETRQAAKPCSSCKPKAEDMEAMVNTVSATKPGSPSPKPVEVVAGEPASEGVDDEDEWTDDEDLLGDDDEPEVVTGTTPAADKARKAPKAAPAAKPANVKAPEVKAEEATALLVKVFGHLDLTVPDPLVFPGFGRAIKTEAKETVYLNSKGTADVRANSPEQAAAWVEAGLAERRGGNYVRVSVRDL